MIELRKAEARGYADHGWLRSFHSFSFADYYDPRQMAQMFRTIQQQGGSGGPEFLSDHPNPGNRYNAIVHESASLRTVGAANTGPAFDAVRSRLAHMPPAPTTQALVNG